MNARPNAILSERSSVMSGGALPWTLIGAALAAMAALYFTSNRFVGLPVLAVLLVFSRFTSWRLPRSTVISYGLRAVLLAVLLTVINRTDPQNTDPWYLKQADTNLVGYALAADIVLRAWERRDAAAVREGLGVVVLMTGLLFATATDTYERVHIQIITPIYAILLLLALRSFALMQQPAGRPRTLRPGLVLLRAVTLLLTLTFAFAGVYGVTRFEYQVSNWAMRYVNQRKGGPHEIGFAASPSLSTVFNPEQSIDRVFVIDGQITEPHLRVAAFHTYQGHQWYPLVSDLVFQPFSPADVPPKQETKRLLFKRFADTADLLAAPLTSASVGSVDPLEQDPSGTLRDTRSGSFEPYEVHDPSAPTFQGALCLKPDEKLRRQLLAIPVEIDPKVVELAIRVAGTGGPARQVFRIQEYLRSHHAYSLSFEPHGEPLNDFILNDRGAHCQYFASAVAIMARAVGVPSRYVGGFYAHEPYGDNQTVVRQRDAHAWAECWIDGVGWVTVDATPSGGLPDRAPAPPAWRRWWEKLSDLPGQIRDWFMDNAPLIKKLAVLAAVVVVGVWMVRRMLRWRRLRAVVTSRYALPNAQLVEMARKYEQWLKGRGMACPPQLTWRAHLAAPKESQSNAQWFSGEKARLCESFVRTYDRARFGADDGEATARARELLDQIERKV